jgi:hypothetical protein
VGKLASYYFVLKSLSHKTKQPLPHLGILEMVIIFIKLWIYFKHFKYFFQQKNGKLHYSIIFYEYVILLYPNFYVLTVDRASPLSVKRSGGRVGGGSTISEKWGNHLPCQPTISALLLGNGGKFEPYTNTI